MKPIVYLSIFQKQREMRLANDSLVSYFPGSCTKQLTVPLRRIWTCFGDEAPAWFVEESTYFCHFDGKTHSIQFMTVPWSKLHSRIIKPSNCIVTKWSCTLNTGGTKSHSFSIKKKAYFTLMLLLANLREMGILKCSKQSSLFLAFEEHTNSLIFS